MSRTVGLLFAVLAGFVGLGFWAWPQVFHTFQFSEPQLSSFQQTDVVNFDGVSVLVLINWLFNYAVTFAFGFLLLRASWPSKLSGVTAWLSGFWLGYIGITGWARLTSLIAGGPLFYVLTLAGVLLYCVWRRKEFRGAFAEERPYLSGASAVFALIVILILQVYQGDFRWNGHGPEQYAVKAAGWFGEPFPILLQHFDEMIYHAFLTEPLGVSYNPILPWWITLGINKVSVFAFLLLLLGELGLRGTMARGARWTGAAFLFAGTLSFIPIHYYQLYDANNPHLYTVHSGRLLSVAFAALFLIWIYTPFRPTRRAQLTYGLGLIAAPITAVLWLPVLWIFLSNNKKVSGTVASLVLAVAGLLLTPWFYNDPSQTLVRLFLLTALGLLAAQMYFLRIRWPKSSGFMVLAGVSLLSALLLGNFLSSQPLGRLFASAFHLEQVTMMYGGMLRLPPLAYLFGDYRELGEAYSIYSASTLDFITIYGFLFWLAAAALLLANRNQLWRWLAILVSALPLVFILVDFTGISRRAWMLTRFLEIPVNLILLLAIVLLLSGRERKWFQPLLWAFIVLPILGTERPQQWFANALALWNLF